MFFATCRHVFLCAHMDTKQTDYEAESASMKSMGFDNVSTNIILLSDLEKLKIPCIWSE